MSPSIGYASLQVIPVIRGIDAQVNRQIGGPLSAAGRRAGVSLGENVESGFGSSIGGLGATAAKAGAAVSAGLLVGAGAIATYGVRLAAANESAAVSFNVLLGSAEKASSFLTQLRDFAATTPFEFPELQKSASQLLAAGIAAEDIIPILTNLGNSTAAFGTGSEGIRRATAALQQMNAAGRITAEDLNQLRDAGVPVFDLLAAATGKTEAEVAKLAATGKLGAEELGQLQDALVSGAGLEQFAGLMDEQSKTLEGIISNLKDTVGQTLATVFTPVLDSAKVLLPAISDEFTRLAESATDLLGPLSTQATPIIEKFVSIGVDGLSNLYDVAAVINPIILDLADAFADTLGPIVEGTSKLIADLAVQMGPSLTEIANSLGDALRDNGDSFVELIDSAEPLIPLVADLTAATVPLITTLIDLLSFLGVENLKVFAGALDAVSGSMEKAGGVATAILSPFAGLADILDNGIDSGSAWTDIVAGALSAADATDEADSSGQKYRKTLEEIKETAASVALEPIFTGLATEAGLVEAQRNVESTLRDLTEAQETAAGRGAEIAELRADAARQAISDAQAVADAEQSAAESIADARDKIAAAIEKVNEARKAEVDATKDAADAQRDMEDALIAVKDAYAAAEDSLKSLELAQRGDVRSVADAKDRVLIAQEAFTNAQLDGDDPTTVIDDVAAAQRDLEAARDALTEAEAEAASSTEELATAQREGLGASDEVTSALGDFETAQQAAEDAETRRLDSIAAVALAERDQKDAIDALVIAEEEGNQRISDAKATLADNARTSSDEIRSAIDDAKAKLPELTLAAELAALKWAEDWADAKVPIDVLSAGIDTLQGKLVPGSPLWQYLERLQFLAVLSGQNLPDVFQPNYNAGGGSTVNRMGGLYAFAGGGVTPAHVAHGTRYKWAEPATGGEAFIPRLGDPARSRSILSQAAAWYGLDIVDKKAGPLQSFQWGGITGDTSSSRGRGSTVVNVGTVMTQARRPREVADEIANLVNR